MCKTPCVSSNNWLETCPGCYRFLHINFNVNFCHFLIFNCYFRNLNAKKSKYFTVITQPTPLYEVLSKTTNLL